MVEAPRVVAVTGASGYVGSRLLLQLEEEGDLGKMVAFDTRPPPLPIHNIAVYRQDVGEDIDDILRNHRVNTLVHLAFLSTEGRNQREVRDNRQTNLNVLHSVLNSCVQARVGHVVYLSSHTVYGAHADNPVPITERAPLRPQPDFPYGYDHYLSDLILESFAERNPHIKVTILRACMVLGPAAGNDITRAFFPASFLGVDGYNPPLQFLHEDDLARVLAAVIRQGAAGVFNVAGDGVVFYREVAKIAQRRLWYLPASLAYPVTRMTRGLGIQRRFTAAGLDLARYPIILSTGNLERAIGYHTRYTSLETLTAFANSVLLDSARVES